MSAGLQQAEYVRCRSARVSGLLARLAIAGVFTLCGVRLFRLTDRYAVNILFRDQWKFDEATLFEQHSMLEIFCWQHGPHRQGLGGILSKVIEPLISWNSRYEAFGILVVLLITAALALWLKGRLIGDLDFADVLIPFILLTPVQYQVIFEGPNPSHGPIPLLLIMLFGLSWTIRNRWMRWLALVIINLMLIYTGFGLFMGVVTPLLLAYEYSRTRHQTALVLLAIALLSFASFFIGYKFNPAAECFSPKPTNPFHYLLFAGFMLSSFVGIQPVSHLLASIVVGFALLGLFLWIFGQTSIRFWHGSDGKAAVPFAVVAYTVLFLFATAYGRICLGLAAAQASRYACYTAAGFFGLYLVARLTRSPVLLGAVSLFALMTTFGLTQWDKRQIARVSEGRRKWRDCFLVYRDVGQCDKVSDSAIYWVPEPPDLEPKLRMLEARKLNLYSDYNHN